MEGVRMPTDGPPFPSRGTTRRNRPDRGRNAEIGLSILTHGYKEICSRGERGSIIDFGPDPHPMMNHFIPSAGRSGLRSLAHPHALSLLRGELFQSAFQVQDFQQNLLYRDLRIEGLR